MALGAEEGEELQVSSTDGENLEKESPKAPE